MANVFLLLTDSDDELDNQDGLRSALGVSVANHYAYVAVLDRKLAPFDEYNEENVEWVRDMDGDVYTNVQENVEVNGLTPISLEELGKKILEMDIIVPYGVE